MKIPHVEQVTVPESKITRYLLDLTSPNGKSKAAFFLAFGFTIELWEVMADALKQHAVTYEVASTRETSYGIHCVVEGVLETPDGRNPQVRVIWKVEHDQDIPSLVTAYPLEK
jgi:hypothetical protein